MPTRDRHAYVIWIAYLSHFEQATFCCHEYFSQRYLVYAHLHLMTSPKQGPPTLSCTTLSSPNTPSTPTQESRRHPDRPIYVALPVCRPLEPCSAAMYSGSHAGDHLALLPYGAPPPDHKASRSSRGPKLVLGHDVLPSRAAAPFAGGNACYSCRKSRA